MRDRRTIQRRLASIACVVTLVLLPTGAIAKDFDALVRLAADNAESPKGREYAPGARSSFGSDHAANARACFSEEERSDVARTRIILEIDASGGIVSTLISTAGAPQTCIEDALLEKKLPKPPFAPFHLIVELQP